MRFLSVGLLVLLVAALLLPDLAGTQEATPRAAPAPTGILAEMLQLAPADIPSSGIVAAYADLAVQTATAGLSLPTSVDDPNFMPWAFALMPLNLPDWLFNFARVADWRSLLGFDVWEIEQSLLVGDPPATVTLLRGQFDPAAISAAWASQNYRLLEIGDVQVASLHEDESFDMTTDLGRYAFARFNNAVILPDGTLAYAPTLDGLRALIAADDGTAPSLGDRIDVAAVVGAIHNPLASALILEGASLLGVPNFGLGLLDATPEIGSLATEVANFAEMPPILLALLGVTPGGPLSRPQGQGATPPPDIPPAKFEIALLLATQPAATTAASVVAARLGTLESPVTKRPFTDFFASWNTDVLSGAPVATIELTFAKEVQPSLWLQLIAQRDLLFLAW